MPLYPVTELDSNQVLKYSFDEATQRLRTDATVNTTITGDVEVVIDHTEDDVLIYGQDESNTHEAIRTNENGNIAIDGIYNGSTNSNPSTSGITAQTRNVTSADSRQAQLPTAKRGTTNTDTVSLDVSIHDHNGNEYSESNPVPTAIIRPDRTVYVFGANSEHVTDIRQVIWDYSGNYSFLSSAENLDITTPKDINQIVKTIGIKI